MSIQIDRRPLLTAAVLGLLLAAPAKAQDLHLRIDPTGFDSFGAAVASLPDIDGDMAPELLVSQTFPRAVVRMFSGSSGALLAQLKAPQQTQALDPLPGFFGFQVSGLGDLDGDGYADVGVTAPKTFVQTPMLTFEQRGAVYLYSGKDGSLIDSVLGPDDNASFDDGYGHRLVPLQDIDLDGVDDFAVSNPSADQNGPLSGSVFIVSGATRQTIRRIDGEASDVELGTFLEAIEDLDGDGLQDLVSASFVGSPNPGIMLRILSSSTGQTLVALDDPGDIAKGIAAIDDFDGDGLEDVLIGRQRTVEVRSSVDGSLLLQLREPGQTAFVQAVERIDDRDGDGLREWAITDASSNLRGGLGVLFLYSGKDGSPIARLDSGTFDSFGPVLLSAGDLDGDGRSEIAIADDKLGSLQVYRGFQDCNGDGLEDPLQIAAGTVADANGNGLPDSCELQPTGKSFCEGVNVYGCEPRIEAFGAAKATPENTFSLVVSDVPGVLPIATVLYGGRRDLLPFVGGTLCIQPPLRRAAVLPLVAGGACGLGFAVDFNQVLLDTGSVSPGQTVFAQCYANDPILGDAFLSNAVRFQVQH